MKYVELRTGPTAESARTGDDLGAVPSQSPRSTSEELRYCRPNEKKQGRQTVMPLTSGELEEETQALPVVQPEDLLDERGEHAVDVRLSDGLGVFTSTAIEPVLSVGREGAGLVCDSLRDGLLAKSGLGRRAGVAGHTRKNPRTIDKPSAGHPADSTNVGVVA